MSNGGRQKPDSGVRVPTAGIGQEVPWTRRLRKPAGQQEETAEPTDSAEASGDDLAPSPWGDGEHVEFDPEGFVPWQEIDWPDPPEPEPKKPTEPPPTMWPQKGLYVVTRALTSLDLMSAPVIRIGKKEETVRYRRKLRTDVQVGSSRFVGASVGFVHQKSAGGKTTTSGNLGNVLTQFMPGRSIAYIDWNQAQTAGGHTSGVYDRTRPVPAWVRDDPQWDLEGFGVPTANIWEMQTAIKKSFDDGFPEWSHTLDRLTKHLAGADPGAVRGMYELIAEMRSRQLLSDQQVLEMMNRSHWGLRTLVANKPNNGTEELTGAWVTMQHAELVRHFELLVNDTGNSITHKHHTALTGTVDVLVFPAVVTMKDACEDLVETMSELKRKFEAEGVDPSRVDQGIIVITGLRKGLPDLDFFVEKYFPSHADNGGSFVAVPWSEVINATRMSRPDLLREHEPEVWYAYLEIAREIQNRLPATNQQVQGQPEQHPTPDPLPIS